MLNAKTIGNFVYGNQYRGNWDDDLVADIISQHADQTHTVLEIGAGAGRVKNVNLRGRVAAIFGLDPDERVGKNPLMDTGLMGLADAIPFRSHSFELVFSINCLEHLEDPHTVFNEVARVLKPGGVFITKTPLKWHYVAVIARLTPLVFHTWFNKRFRKRDEADTFPTLYRVNSITAQKRIARLAGLAVRDMVFCEGRPGYLAFNTLAYCLGILYERMVTLLRLNGLKSVVITTFEKPV